MGQGGTQAIMPLRLCRSEGIPRSPLKILAKVKNVFTYVCLLVDPCRQETN